ncbi:MAG TPA: hypothetical protein VIT18_07535, partial [Terrimicrobiaceae bacterium]
MLNDSGFLGSLYSDTRVVQAGSWRQIRLTYVVGIAGLAKGGSFKIVFRSDSDWADFQTWDPSGENYLSAEVVLRDSISEDRPAQILALRYDSTGDRKSILVTVVEGGLTAGDIIHVRLGDRRYGGRGTRVQTFAEERFLWRTLVDCDGVSGYSELDPAPELVITAGPPGNLRIIAAPTAPTGAAVPVLLRVEDWWGNVSEGLTERAFLEVCDPNGKTVVSSFEWGHEPWAIYRARLHLTTPGEYHLRAHSEACATDFVILAQDAAELGRLRPTDS